MGVPSVYVKAMKRAVRDRLLVRAAAVAAFVCVGVSVGCASGNGSSEPSVSDRDPDLRMIPDRVFDGERPFIRGNPVGVELHWWLTQDSDGVVARALAPYDGTTDFLPDEVRERLRLSGVRVVAVPLSEIFVVHQVAAPNSAWSRRWLGQSPDWLQIMRSRRIAEGTRSSVYGSEQRLPDGVLRLLGRAWIVPERVEREDGASIDASMRLELIAQVQQRDPQVDRENNFEIPRVTSVSPALEEQGPLLEELLIGLTVPPGYAIVLTSAAPEADWSRVEGVTRENLIEELERRESDATGEPAEEDQQDDEAPEPARFGPSPVPSDIPTDVESDQAQVFETLDAPMPTLANSFGPRAAPLPTVGQLLLESRDRLSRPMRGVVILIPRLPSEFRLLP